jgi:hypothetical protein
MKANSTSRLNLQKCRNLLPFSLIFPVASFHVIFCNNLYPICIECHQKSLFKKPIK